MPDEPSFIPDEAKGDVIKFLSTPIWVVVEKVWRQRRPDSPVFTDSLHAVACQYAYQEGFDKAVEILSKLPWESLPVNLGPNQTELERKLLDPRD